MPAADASLLNDKQNPPRLKVSITTRLLTALCYTIPALGGALSSIFLINVFQALRNAETAGIAAVMAGMKEASIPVLVSLYLAAFCGIGVIIVLIVRLIVETKTSSPPGWFFAVGGILCLLPAGLFWKAQLLIMEVLSPGSSVSAGGIGAAGAEISQWLVLSVIAAPVVFILLAAASVIPLSSRKKLKWSPLIAAAAIEILLLATAIGIPFLINEPKRKNETVNLPENVKYVDYDYDIDKETSMILTLTSDNKLKQKNNVPGKAERTENIITKEELAEKLKNFSEVTSPDKQIVYLKADINASYENVLQVFDIIRKAEIGKVGLVVIGEKKESDPYQTYAAKLEVKLPAPIDETDEPARPNPLTLAAMLKSDGTLTLNNEEMGTISAPEKLENKLVEVFKQREANGIFREGTNEVEKTVFLKVSKSSKYGDFIKLVEAVRGAGTEPVGIQFDDLNFN
ncbi:MAG TPA: biopolymer transporter ExbD [Pyrinomonadaceae bacterium]